MRKVSTQSIGQPLTLLINGQPISTATVQSVLGAQFPGHNVARHCPGVATEPPGVTRRGQPTWNVCPVCKPSTLLA